jgi:hypothetical protein
MDGVSDKLVYDLKRMIEVTVDEKLTRKLAIDEAYASMEPARQMLSFNGHYLNDDSQWLKELDLQAFDTIVLENQGTLLPLAVSNIVAYLGPIITFTFLYTQHWRIYTNILEPDSRDTDWGNIVLYVEPQWLRALRHVVCLQFTVWIFISMKWHNTSHLTRPFP